ncbi:G-protein alpha subunit [Stereum hirsutum FP-91666 SS1]|uniref:G-protein alpha subunit n=1 Tax=Stereum hirsutum (strain FP-91666) TaxID=721885 RepID=UPI000444A5AC|nr:G-protein alpha subunit [Stereum hirsutum FP-91666 SS1]EIM81071.1 G-protein alpha subunit [Stereum hirsutum FP-91666 SS1]
MPRRPASAPSPRMPGIVDDAEARRISKSIDEMLKQEREGMKKKQSNRKDVKVMLLGQAESGKSTLQKQFQLYYASQTLDRERPSWRPIVFFNVIKAVRTILEELEMEFTNNQTDNSFSSLINLGPNWPDEIGRIRTKLLPLITIEDNLASELSNGVSVAGGRSGVYVRAGWQALVTPTRSWPLSDIRNSLANAKAGVMANMAARQLHDTKYDVERLWRHPAVKALLRLRKLRLDESASFFLEEVHRLSEPEYMPTTEDILHVRLQTLGVTEHTFDINFGGGHYNWYLYDVGGARHAWVPYFDDATAIIFLAPISAFDQYLEEDPRTNRIDDSLQLFTAICTNKLLKNSSLVLMLNKTDLLKKKLQSGIVVKKYITSYGERPNRYEDVSEYFRAHFSQVHKRKGQSRQKLFVHFTSMLDVSATQKIIVDVNEAIIRSYLGQSGLA